MINTEGRTETNYIHGGIQYIYEFDNGFGASVIRHEGSYGFDRDLWEVAVLDNQGKLCFSTKVTSDVMGYLTEEEVNSKINEIRGLQTPQNVV